MMLFFSGSAQKEKRLVERVTVELTKDQDDWLVGIWEKEGNEVKGLRPRCSNCC